MSGCCKDDKKEGSSCKDKKKENSALESFSKKERAKLEDITGEYMGFLDDCKTPELVVNEVLLVAERSGLISYNPGLTFEDAPEGFYLTDVDGRQFALVLPGKRPVYEAGASLLASHTDSPCLNLKTHPIREGPEGVVLAAKPYGGIWLHQWTDTKVDIIGHGREKGELYTVTLDGMLSERGVHISRQSVAGKKLDDAFPHEMLKVITGIKDKKEFNDVLKSVGLTDETFFNNTWYVIPSEEGKMVGSLMTAYGHDDRICVYTTVKSALDSVDRTFPVVVYGASREEIGSTGTDSAQSPFLESAVDALMLASGMKACSLNGANLRTIFRNSRMLSCDVEIALTTYDKGNQDEEVASRFNKGIALVKSNGGSYQYGGHLTSDEMAGYTTSLLKGAGVVYQTSEIPTKLEAGGGGTLAKFFAHRGIPTIDAGPPVGNMHGKNQLAHIGDFGQTLKAYRAFIERKK
ncbi:MAG: hypothetical protein V1729_04920 [Candidatus Woesearchaeota archaeon]